MLTKICSIRLKFPILYLIDRINQKFYGGRKQIRYVKMFLILLKFVDYVRDDRG